MIKHEIFFKDVELISDSFKKYVGDQYKVIVIDNWNPYIEHIEINHNWTKEKENELKQIYYAIDIENEIFHELLELSAKQAVKDLDYINEKRNDTLNTIFIWKINSIEKNEPEKNKVLLSRYFGYK